MNKIEERLKLIRKLFVEEIERIDEIENFNDKVAFIFVLGYLSNELTNTMEEKMKTAGVYRKESWNNLKKASLSLYENLKKDTGFNANIEVKKEGEN